MKNITRIATVLLLVTFGATVQANKYGSVEPIANEAVIDTSPLSAQPLRVREAFAQRLLQCGIVGQVVDALSSTHAITTINNLNISVSVGAGGFAGRTNPSFVYTVIDACPNAASEADVKLLTDGLGYVLSQASAFLLDSDNPSSFDFPANYVVLNFPTPPTIAVSAALFRTVGRIDPELFETDTSGYTQFGRAYLSLQSDVPNQQFIDGDVEAAAQFGVEYTPIVGGVPSLFEGGAAFPGNDWTVFPRGEDYLSRIPEASHRALGRIRAFHLRDTRRAPPARSPRSLAGFVRLPLRSAGSDHGPARAPWRDRTVAASPLQAARELPPGRLYQSVMRVRINPCSLCVEG